MTIYVRRLTRVTALKVSQANDRTTSSSGVYFFLRKLRFLTCARHIDGHDYFYALSEMLDSARECIFILVRVVPHTYTIICVTLVKDWWLTPELYLRRPPAYHPEWRLDRVLKRKAEQGVKIYVVVYKEVRICYHQ
jgi:phosphatidylserine/phosphatidylglycerophosphate/cardiolipin synthase-like enzyme